MMNDYEGSCLGICCRKWVHASICDTSFGHSLIAEVCRHALWKIEKSIIEDVFKKKKRKKGFTNGRHLYGYGICKPILSLYKVCISLSV